MTTASKRLLAALALEASALVASGRAADEVASPSPDRPYSGQLSNLINYHVEFDYVFTAPYKTKLAKVWLPIPQTNARQAITNYKVDPTAASMDEEPTFGNRLAYLEFANPLGGQIIHVSYDAAVSEVRWNLDPAKVVTVAHLPTSFTPFLTSGGKIEVDDEVRRIAAEVAGTESNPALVAQKLMVWVIDHMEYGHDLCSLQASTKHALENHKGHCSDYHGLTIALLRARGIPARLCYGINPIDAKKPSPSHCKAEIYLEPYGWVNFDVSEADKVITKAEKDPALSVEAKAQVREETLARLFSGFMDNTWIRNTIGTGYDFAPKTTEGTPSLVRTAYIEADGQALPDPDPGNPNKREFAWMLIPRYKTDRTPVYPWSY
ncbi:MAG: transglutaminase domain-containing protein [Planctomycetes bacterium]|nr:transglutaminase domain-containing protein [Planctomycetota bacterium]MBI3846864.1 transglutaminase domain-containing protein [Planctomycetota bacterium]